MARRTAQWKTHRMQERKETTGKSGRKKMKEWQYGIAQGMP
jgi:hypothetical protein